MPPLFNTIRACVYGAIFNFTLICIAMAGHFQRVLATSDLTRFVPFAIFVCTISFLIFIVLLGTSFLLRERNPISTRIELGCLGFAGFLWLVLGSFLASSESQSADVECFASASDLVPLDKSVASFQTEQYQAMYRVLMVFSLINATLALLTFLILLFLAIRRHRMGDEHMWYGPVTSCAWFNDYGNGKSILPRHNVNAARSMATVGGARKDNYTRPSEHWMQRALAFPRRAQHARNVSSGASSLIEPSMSSREFDDGRMVNPNKSRRK